MAIGGILVATIFFPKMHTISQQSKYRKLKLHSGSGSDSTVSTAVQLVSVTECGVQVYTSYTDGAFPGYSAGYPYYYSSPYHPPGQLHYTPHHQRYSGPRAGQQGRLRPAPPHLNR